jgi:hypothetical protein
MRLTSEDVKDRRVVRMSSLLDIPGEIWGYVYASRSNRLFGIDRSHVAGDRWRPEPGHKVFCLPAQHRG